MKKGKSNAKRAMLARRLMKAFLHNVGKNPGDLGKTNADYMQAIADYFGVELSGGKWKRFEQVEALMAKSLGVATSVVVMPRSQPNIEAEKESVYRRVSKALEKITPPEVGKATVKKIAAERKAFYESREWRSVRYRALKLHGGKCQCCGQSPPNVVLHVDHIKPRSRHPELELEVNNLQVLCEDCNLGKSAWDQTDWRPHSHSEPPGQTGVGEITPVGQRKLN